MSRRYFRRRAVTMVQWCVVAALIILVIVASVTLVGNRTSTKLNETASDLTNPSSLTARFGNSPSSGPSVGGNANSNGS